MNLATIQHHSHMKSAVVDACVQVGSPLAPVTVYAAPAPAVTYAAPAPVPVYVAPAPAVTHAALAPVFEYVTPAPVFGFIAPAPAGSFVAPSQQLRPAYTAASVVTGVNFDADVVGSSSQVVGSLPHGEVFAAPVFHQVHQVPLAGGEIPENLVEIPVVPEQVIPLRVVDSLPPDDGSTAYVARRPFPLVEVRPSSRAQRHTMEDLGELAPLVQILGLAVPRTVDSVTEVLRFLDCPLVEQVIFVPKISCSPCPSRSRVPEPQSADQLVEVPTVLTPTRIALQIAERIVDTPVSRGQVKAAKKELRERRQEMVDELAVLWENFLPSERTPSVERRIAQLVSALEASASSKPSKRKRKKRRKKRLPRSPRPLLHVRAHRRLRQWLVPGWSFCAALGQGWHARCGTTTGAWFDGLENC